MAYNQDQEKEIVPQNTVVFSQPEIPDIPVPPLPIVATPLGAVLSNGEFASPNYRRGESGWRIDSEGNAEFQSLTIAGTFVEISKGTFGGDGTDGVLAITSGTTTLDLGASKVFSKNYSSISITGTGSLTFTNPHTNGTIIILKSQGAVTITSSATRAIDARGFGGQGGATDTSGSEGTGILDDVIHYGLDGSVRTAGLIYTNKFLYTNTSDRLARLAMFIHTGSGGGGGASGAGGGTAGGSGGSGGAGLLIRCGGALNFTGTIDVSGKNGSDGVDLAAVRRSGGGGGGGSCGQCIILYNSLTVNSGTITASGGAGGRGGDTTGAGAGTSAGGGGGGAGAYGAAGGNGASPNGIGSNAGGSGAGAGGGGGEDSNGSFGAGGTGGSSDSSSGLVALNDYFA